MLIGINGTKGSGKDTVGKYLVEEYGFQRLSFADKLKQSAANLFDIPIERWEEWKNDDSMEVLIQRNLSSEIGRAKLAGEDIPIDLPHVRLTVRYFLQRYGTESHRNIFGDDFWVEALFKNYDPFDGNDYVITDARFANELRKIKELNGINIRLIRRQDLPEDLHPSESSPPPIYIDSWIGNEGSLDELYDSIDEFMIQFALVDKSVSSFKA